MGGTVGDIMSVIPPSFPGIKVTSVPSPLNGRLDRLVSLRQARNRIMIGPLGKHFRFGMKHGRYTSTTNRTRVTSIHGVNFSFNAMTSSISSAIFLVSKYPGRFDCLVGIIKGHGGRRTRRFGGFGGSGSGAFRVGGRGREAGHYSYGNEGRLLVGDSLGEK